MGCFSAPSPQGEGPLQKEVAKITQEQWYDYTTRYAPLMEKMFADVTNPESITKSVADATAGIDKQYDIAGGDINRGLQKYHITQDPAQARTTSRLLNMDRLATRVGTANQTRLGAMDTQEKLRGEMLDIGTGIRQEAMGTYNAGIGLESARLRANATAQGQQAAANTSAVGTAAALALAFLSDRDKKMDIRPADTRQHLAEMRALRLKNYRYKPEAGPEGERTGVMWQESPEVRAQYGKLVSLGDWNAKNTGAIQELDKEVRNLRAAVLKLGRRAA